MKSKIKFIVSFLFSSLETVKFIIETLKNWINCFRTLEVFSAQSQFVSFLSESTTNHLSKFDWELLCFNFRMKVRRKYWKIIISRDLSWLACTKFCYTLVVNLNGSHVKNMMRQMKKWQNNWTYFTYSKEWYFCKEL